MDFQFNRKIIINRWILNARWFYSVGILLIGYLSKTISDSNVNFSLALMATLFVIFLSVNAVLFYILKKAEQTNSVKLLGIVSYTQVIMELIFFAYILHSAGGIESISMIFFFLPVVTSSLVFRAQGSIIAAFIGILIINFSALAEYTGLISHISRYNVSTLEYLDLSITLTKTITVSIFYLIIAFFSGYSGSLLHDQEKLFEEKVKQLGQQSKILARREQELFVANTERDKKIQELERFQKFAVGRELRMIELKEKLKQKAVKILQDF